MASSSASSLSLVGNSNVAASSVASGSSSAASSSSKAAGAMISTPIHYSGSNSKLVALFAGIVGISAVLAAL
ncbi:unnamed protein product [Ambrosiozyma monospora]|uniref:Unnamed protein product n=1 Tax=Ambrosiozyma monospora TaxID=43982 RepID=A0A9W7DIT3_AMBMO|nr:unnamed protein product [Ambrosiozyma monospora]